MNRSLPQWRDWLLGFVGRGLAPSSAPLDAAGLAWPLQSLADERVETAFITWRLRRREWLNPGSSEAPVWRLSFDVPPGQRWTAGDLVEVLPPEPRSQPRRYAIASLSEEGHLELLVGLSLHGDGQPGTCSSWLCVQRNEGETVPMRVRANPVSRLPEGDQPLLLIGSGTGVAMLRSLLRERAARAQSRNWLVFAGRSLEHDFFYGDELLAWQADGHLQRLDLAFSRESKRGGPLEQRLCGARGELRNWLARDALIYVCGNRAQLAGPVERALRDALGAQGVAELRRLGRYRSLLY